MYQRNYADYYIKEDPDSPFSKFLVKFFSRKPDLEKMGREVRQFDEELHAIQMQELRERLAAKAKERAFHLAGDFV